MYQRSLNFCKQPAVVVVNGILLTEIAETYGLRHEKGLIPGWMWFRQGPQLRVCDRMSSDSEIHGRGTTFQPCVLPTTAKENREREREREEEGEVRGKKRSSFQAFLREQFEREEAREEERQRKSDERFDRLLAVLEKSFHHSNLLLYFSS